MILLNCIILMDSVKVLENQPLEWYQKKRSKYSSNIPENWELIQREMAKEERLVDVPLASREKRTSILDAYEYTSAFQWQYRALWSISLYFGSIFKAGMLVFNDLYLIQRDRQMKTTLKKIACKWKWENSFAYEHLTEFSPYLTLSLSFQVFKSFLFLFLYSYRICLGIDT